MGATATPSRIDQKWQFRLRIQGLTVGHFTTASGLEAEVDMTEYHQGGDPDPAVQTPGKRKHTPLTLGIGSSDNDELWQMWKKVYDAQGKGLSLDSLRVKIFIDTLDRDGETVLSTETYNRAIMSKFKGGEYDASSSDNRIKEVTFHFKNADETTL